MSNRIEIPPALHALLEVEDQTAPIWIVGGAVRDLLLQRPSQDYDFVTSGEAVALARRVANRLSADIYILDKERDAARVLYIDQTHRRYTFDFAKLRGESIESDLRARDFTINAMAFRISSMEELVDPCGGLQHLHAGLIELCHEKALEDDPIRSLRAIRIATELTYQLSPWTVSALGSVPSFETISSERVRDELFKITSLDDPTAAFQLFKHFKLLLRIFPFPDDLGISLNQQEAFHFSERSTRRLATILHLLSDKPDLDIAAEATLGLMMWTLGRFRAPLSTYLLEEMTYDRNRRSLLFLINFLRALLQSGTMDIDSRDVQQSMIFSVITWLGKHLRLSRFEVEWALNWAGGMDLLEADLENLKWSDVNRYRYFRTVGEAGIGSALSMLAYKLASQIEPPNQGYWAGQLEKVRLLLEAWFEKYDIVIDPKPIISGEDVLQVLDVRPGPVVGEMLERVREAQVEGHVSTREQALTYLKTQVGS